MSYVDLRSYMQDRNAKERTEKKRKLADLLDKYGESKEAIDKNADVNDSFEYMLANGDRLIDEVLEERRRERENSSFPQTPYPSAARGNPNYIVPRNLPEMKDDGVSLRTKSRGGQNQGSSKFDRLVNSVLQEEGGYEDNPKKIDQPTNMGITQNTLNNFNRAHPDFRINKRLKDLSEDEARLIYKRDFYDAYRLEDVEDPSVARTMFHMFVNSSPTNMATIIQHSINSLGGKVAVDGTIGSESVNAINKLNKEGRSKELNEKLIELRLKYEDSLKGHNKYPGRRKRFNRLLEE